MWYTSHMSYLFLPFRFCYTRPFRDHVLSSPKYVDTETYRRVMQVQVLYIQEGGPWVGQLAACWLPLNNTTVRRQLITYPPSTTMAEPWTKDALALQRKSTQSATSCAVPGRFMGAIAMAGANVSIVGRVIGVSITPGQTQLTRMLSLEYCRYVSFVTYHFHRDATERGRGGVCVCVCVWAGESPGKAQA